MLTPPEVSIRQLTRIPCLDSHLTRSAEAMAENSMSAHAMETRMVFINSTPVLVT
jgi:hypothetical protein